MIQTICLYVVYFFSLFSTKRIQNYHLLLLNFGNTVLFQIFSVIYTSNEASVVEKKCLCLRKNKNVNNCVYIFIQNFKSISAQRDIYLKYKILKSETKFSKFIKKNENIFLF